MGGMLGCGGMGWGWFDLNITMSSGSGSRSVEREREKRRSRSQDKPQGTKLFITNLDGEADPKLLEKQLRELFEKYGSVDTVVAKRNRNSAYCFAFAELRDHETAALCVKNYDQSTLGGKKIKVEFQDDTKRRKDSELGCYNCGRKGHFARECKAPRLDERGQGRRSRSRSPSYDRSRRHRHRRDRSDSRRRSTSRDRKQRRHRSRDREEKKKKYKRSSS